MQHGWRQQQYNSILGTGTPGIGGFPTVILSTAATSPVSAAFSVTATFSRVVTGLALGDITVTNGSASNLAGSGAAYTFDVTPDWAGDVSVQIAANVVDQHNLASNVLALTIAAPANTISPAINANAVIGTQITGDDGTWTGAVSYTYQWQRNTGTFVNIGSATNKNYTPVDADFGYALRLVVTATNGAGSTAANSNATTLAQEAPAESLGSEVATNGTMETGNPPGNWNPVSATLSGQADERTGGAGAQCLQVVATATGNLYAAQTVNTVTNGLYLVDAWLKNIDASNCRMQFTGLVGTTITSTSWTHIYSIMRAAGATESLRCQPGVSAIGQGAKFDDVSVKPITLNGQLSAPSANMRLDQFYTLPAAPIAGSQIWLYPRISDFSLGNYWKIELVYSGSQWDINLYSVATFTKTSRIAATNIGATNGVRVNMNADQLSLYTTANGGANWTQRGTTITNNTYQTATGANALWTSDFTPGNMVYAPAD